MARWGVTVTAEEVAAVTTPAQLQACHLVYVGSGGTTLANTLDPRSPVLLVTDADASNADVAACRALGVDVICVPVALTSVAERAS